MHRRWHAEGLPLVPAEIAGLVLVALAGLLLAGGLGSAAASPAAVGRWVLAAGLLLLLGAALATVLLGASVSSRRPTGSTGPPSFPSLGPEGVDDVDTQPVPSISPRMGRPIHASSPSTSIPGAYLAAITSSGGNDLPAWEPAPPIAAALPLAAIRSSPGAGTIGAEEETSALLEVELARLRARLREIEGSPPARPAPTPRLDVSGASRTAGPFAHLTTGRPGAPSPPDRRSCAACGRPVPQSTAPPSLCASCGRLLCATCAPRHGGANGLLTCPDCATRQRAESISGGRAGPRPSPGATD